MNLLNGDAASRRQLQHNVLCGDGEQAAERIGEGCRDLVLVLDVVVLPLSRRCKLREELLTVIGSEPEGKYPDGSLGVGATRASSR